MAVMYVCLASLVVLCACRVSCVEQTTDDVTETAKEAFAEAVFQANLGLADCEADESSRKKRSAFVANRDLPSDGYNAWSSLPLADFTLYPGLMRTSAFNLPSQRFFSSFSPPARIVRTTDGSLSRYYYKSGNYEQAYKDFMGLPLINRQLVTQTRTDVVQSVETLDVQQPVGYRAVSRSYPNNNFQLCNNCCYNNNPCITSYVGSQRFPDRLVRRYYVYLS